MSALQASPITMGEVARDSVTVGAPWTIHDSLS